MAFPESHMYGVGDLEGRRAAAAAAAAGNDTAAVSDESLADVEFIPRRASRDMWRHVSRNTWRRRAYWWNSVWWMVSKATTKTHDTAYSGNTASSIRLTEVTVVSGQWSGQL